MGLVVPMPVPDHLQERVTILDYPLLHEYGVLDDESFDELEPETQEAYFEEVLSNQAWRLNSGLYSISNEDGEIVPFRCRPQQLKMLTTAPYVIILKARQVGFSSAIGIANLDTCLFNKNYRAGLVAHTEAAARGIFGLKVRDTYNYLPRWLRTRITLVTDSAHELKFSNGSSISHRTSYRSSTLNALHGSELGKISLKQKDADEFKSGSLPTVTDSLGRVFIESTAEGASGYFYDLWNKAVAGESKFTALFVPWYTDPKYQRTPPAGWNVPLNYSKYFATFENDDVQLSIEQKYWYFEESEDKGRLMLQEYPSTPEEAFLHSGRSVFDMAQLSDQRKYLQDPIKIYSCARGGVLQELKNPQSGTGEQLAMSLVNNLMVFEAPWRPKSEHLSREMNWIMGNEATSGYRYYTVGVDTAGYGQVGNDSDYTCIDVCDQFGVQVAFWRGRLKETEQAYAIKAIAEYYNDAFVIVENNNHGLAVLQSLSQIYRYSRIYKDHQQEKPDAENEEVEVLGFRTTTKSKPLMISKIHESLFWRDSGLRCYVTYAEMRTYVHDEKGRMNAMEGRHDDSVISRALALYGRTQRGARPFYKNDVTPHKLGWHKTKPAQR